MAVLFRPWARPGEELQQQDSTISTTTSSDVQPLAVKEEVSELSRDVKYRSVKDHMKRRSEKRCRRTILKCQVDRMNSDTRQESSAPLAIPLASPNLEPPLSIPVPPFSVNLPTYPAKFFEPVERLFRDGWDDFSLASPELLEVALSQGLPPNLVEEYAHLLTEQQRQIADRNRKQRPKKFRCPHCDVGFSNNGQLKGHIRIHTGERPYKCEADNCGKSFTRNEELTRHRRIHSGLRPFPCPECGKRFGRKDHLKKHVRTHFQQRYQLVPIFHSQYPYLFGL